MQGASEHRLDRTGPTGPAGDAFPYHIAPDNPYTARHPAGQYPPLGRPGRIDGTRERVMANIPYCLPYRMQKHRSEILAVYLGAPMWPKDP